jgi:hypothetical protein
LHVQAIPFPAKPEPLGGLKGLIGRCFLHPALDYAFVGGGITIPIFLAIYFFPGLTPTETSITLRSFLLINGAHFAASTLRLYTKPGARQDFPFLSWGFPVVCLLAVGMGLYWPVVGRNLTALYFTWSPYHYAAQTYGLAVMYAMRSGARLEQQDKTQIWWVCLLPFLYSFLTSQNAGLAWFVPQEWLLSAPAMSLVYRGLVGVVTIGIFALPISLFWQLHRMRGKSIPLISLLLQITNGIWWLGTDYLNGWWWTAMFHSIQYLVIVTVQHSKEQMARTDGRQASVLHRPSYYVGTFYGVCILLAVVLFFALPMLYVPLGFEAAQATVVVVSVINLHHFIVDGFIWRTKPPAAAPALSNAQARVQVAV